MMDTPVIPATWEAEIRNKEQAGRGKACLSTQLLRRCKQEDESSRLALAQKCKTLSEKAKAKRAGGIAQVVEHLTSPKPWIQTQHHQKHDLNIC
jgi:hypothetical protein